MSKLKKLTFDELIAKKIERDKNEIKFKEIEVPSLGGTLLFEKPLEDDITNCLDSIDDEKSITSMLQAYNMLIYNCCPTLKDTKLQEGLNVKVPTDIVKEMFDMNDRMLIGNELVDLSGIQGYGEKIKK